MTQQHDSEQADDEQSINPITPEGVEADADADPGSPEWEAYIDNLLRRVLSNYDLGDCMAYIHRPYRGPDEDPIYSLRLIDPTDNHVEYDIGPSFFATEFEAFLRGLEVAGFDTIETKAGTVDDE